MKVGAPGWGLRIACPCCGQGGLGFSTCPGCGHVVLIGAEVGTIFPDPHDLARTLTQDYAVGPPCPSCSGRSLLDYRNSTSDEIKALGFAPDQYC